jgi:hypothetical protein
MGMKQVHCFETDVRQLFRNSTVSLNQNAVDNGDEGKEEFNSMHWTLLPMKISRRD